MVVVQNRCQKERHEISKDCQFWGHWHLGERFTVILMLEIFTEIYVGKTTAGWQALPSSTQYCWIFQTFKPLSIHTLKRQWPQNWHFCFVLRPFFYEWQGHVTRSCKGPILGFHSRDQQPYFSTKTKESVCIIIELNSRRIWSGLQHGRRFFV